VINCGCATNCGSARDKKFAADRRAAKQMQGCSGAFDPAPMLTVWRRVDAQWRFTPGMCDQTRSWLFGLLFFPVVGRTFHPKLPA
jgi:hypothetical protein